MTNEGRNELSGSTVVWIRNKQLEIRLCKPEFLKLGWHRDLFQWESRMCIFVCISVAQSSYIRGRACIREPLEMFVTEQISKHKPRAGPLAGGVCWASLFPGSSRDVLCSFMLLNHRWPFVLFLRFLRPSDVFSRDRSYVLVNSHHIIQPVLWLLKRSFDLVFPVRNSESSW